MKIGMTLWFQHQEDYWARAKQGDYTKPNPVPDAQVYRENLELADMAEPMGFESVWTIEHHFGPYGMTGNPLQFLTYMAGRTSTLKLGTMVVVLPWHDPIRVAESICMLDVMSGGNRLLLGFGRGAAPKEFAAFRVDYAESRERMDESLEIVRLALTQEFFEFNGKYFQIPPTTIRPRPITVDLTEHMMCAWSSEETMKWVAESGVGPMYNNFHDWKGVSATNDRFNAMRAARGWPPMPPVCSGPIFVAETAAEADDARKWYRDTIDSSIWHYGLFDQPSMRARLVGKTGAELQAAVDEIYADSMRTGIFGTPDQVLAQLTDIQHLLGLGHLQGHFNFGRMPHGVAKKSVELFAREVLPALKELPSPEIRATPFEEVRAARTAVSHSERPEAVV